MYCILYALHPQAVPTALLAAYDGFVAAGRAGGARRVRERLVGKAVHAGCLSDADKAKADELEAELATLSARRRNGPKNIGRTG